MPVLDPANLTPEQEKARAVLDVYSGLLSFKKTEVVEVLRRATEDIVAIFAGNRAGKTSSVAEHYTERMLGLHPVSRKNVLAKKIRCMSSSLPEGNDPDVQDNAQ